MAASGSSLSGRTWTTAQAPAIARTPAADGLIPPEGPPHLAGMIKGARDVLSGPYISKRRDIADTSSPLTPRYATVCARLCRNIWR